MSFQDVPKGASDSKPVSKGATLAAPAHPLEAAAAAGSPYAMKKTPPPPTAAPAPPSDAERGMALAAFKEDVAAFAQQVTAIGDQLAIVGTARDSQDLRLRLNVLVKNAQGQMKTLTETAKRLKHSGGGTGTATQQRDILIDGLMRHCKQLQQFTKAAAEKEHVPLPASALAAAKAAKETAMFSPVEEDDDRAREKQGLLEAERRNQMAQIEAERQFHDTVQAERDAAIRDIETAVVQVNEIFRDLANLVQEQQGMIDNIEVNVQSAHSNAEKAVGELHQAAKYERSARTKMCIILVIAMIALAVVVVVIVLPSVLLTKKKN
jgi:syntaxin 7